MRLGALKLRFRHGGPCLVDGQESRVTPSPPSPSLQPSSRAGLNRGPHPYQGCALPTELRERRPAYPLASGDRQVPLTGESERKLCLEAGDGTRTRDPQLGRLMLYQLSYTRVVGSLLPRIHGGGRIRTYVGHSPADLQSATISHSVTPPNRHPPSSETEPRRQKAGSVSITQVSAPPS